MKYADRYGNRWEKPDSRIVFWKNYIKRTGACGGKSAGTSVGFQNGWLAVEPESILLADPVILKRTSDGSVRLGQTKIYLL